MMDNKTTCVQLPVWLKKSEEHVLNKPMPKWWATSDYLEKTLRDIQVNLAYTNEQIANAKRDMFLQQLEPRCKAVGIGVLILAAAVSRNLYGLCVLNILIFAGSLSAGIRTSDYITRVLLPVGIFSGIAALPAVFNIVTPGQALYVIYAKPAVGVLTDFFPSQISITQQGVSVYLFIIARAATTLGLVGIFIQTTKWHSVVATLKAFGLPDIFAMVLDLAYRYIFLFMNFLSEHILGRKSRIVGKEHVRSGLHWVGISIAAFFRTAGYYSMEISQAMVIRGYTGKVTFKLNKAPTWREGTYILVAIIIAFFVQ